MVGNAGAEGSAVVVNPFDVALANDSTRRPRMRLKQTCRENAPNRPPLLSAVPVLSLLGILAPGSALPATADDTNAEIAALKSAVERRDAIIDELLTRVALLERRVGAAETAAPQASTAAPARNRPSTPTADANAPPRGNPNAAPKPGAVEVDPLAAERALERTLTLEGALLLPSGQYELEPYVDYARRESDQSVLVADQSGVAVRRVEARRNEVDFGLRARAGLPWDTQIELDIPYRVVDQSVVVPSGPTGLDKRTNNASTLGDIKAGLAKTLLRQDRWWPDLVARITWDSDSGERIVGDVPLGIGFNELRGSLTALARQDPLAFTANLSYEASFEKDDVDPGDELGVSFGVSLAASPETSLSMALVQSFSEETRIAGRDVPGSDEVSSVLALGASSILGRNVLLSVSAAVGLTDAAPDYTFALSLPVRF
jgi:hypothetical protein